MIEKISKKPLLTRVALCIILLLMAAIFIFSSQGSDASANISSGVTYTAVSLLVEDFDSMPDTLKQQLVEAIHPTVRNAAHFSAFAALGIAAFMLVMTLENKTAKSFAYGFGACAAYAVLDELHQLLSPGRACQISDVFTDSLGALTGMLIAACAVFIAEGIKLRICNAHSENSGETDDKSNKKEYLTKK